MRVEEEAREAVEEQRTKHYGPPNENHGRTAHLWNAYIEVKGITRRLDEEDVCNFNILQKMSRDMHTKKRDNIVDQIGYLINIAKIREEDGD